MYYLLKYVYARDIGTDIIAIYSNIIADISNNFSLFN